MMSYLSIAYIIFITFPLALAVSIYLQRRRIERRIEEIKKAKT